jgi:hypothetical protein
MNADFEYIPIGEVPKSIPKGRVLIHNHVARDVSTPSGEGGFLAWTEPHAPSGFIKCRCGWSGLPHYARGALWKTPEGMSYNDP